MQSFKIPWVTLKIINLTYFSENVITFFKKKKLILFWQYIRMDLLGHEKHEVNNKIIAH